MGWKGANPYEGQVSSVSLGDSLLERVAVWVGTGFGLGLVAPFAPGTWGSLPGVALACGIAALGMPIWAQCAVALALALLAVPICTHCEDALKCKDDGRITADEWMLYPIAFIGIPIMDDPIFLLLSFGVVRVLDILKLPPASQVQYLPRGWGIVADDFISQLFALAVNWGLYVWLFS